MSAMKNELDRIVARSLATGEPIPEEVADALDDLLDVRGLSGAYILDLYPDNDWALALAQHRRREQAEDAAGARRTATMLGRILLAGLAGFFFLLAMIVASFLPGTIVTAVFTALSILSLSLFLYSIIYGGSR